MIVGKKITRNTQATPGRAFHHSSACSVPCQSQKALHLPNLMWPPDLLPDHLGTSKNAMAAVRKKVCKYIDIHANSYQCSSVQNKKEACALPPQTKTQRRDSVNEHIYIHNGFMSL